MCSFFTVSSAIRVARLMKSVHGSRSSSSGSVMSCCRSSSAVVLFTSGSTSKPKAVPLTHRGLLWQCARKLGASGEVVAQPAAGSLCFLPNFHVIGWTNNFLFNLYAGIRCAVQHQAESAPLSPRLMLQASAELQSHLFTPLFVHTSVHASVHTSVHTSVHASAHTCRRARTCGQPSSTPCHGWRRR